MHELKAFFNFLVTSDIVDLANTVQEKDDKWALVRDIGGLTTGTAFANRDEMINRISTAVISQYQQRGAHLKAAV